MAFLYIDRLKSDFQRADHSIPRANIHKRWCPQTVIKRLKCHKFDDCYEQFQIKSVSMNFAPKVPKIFTIGLRLDRKETNDANARQTWNIAVIRNLLRHYFSFIRRYQSYLCVSWKPTPGENCNQWNVPFTSFKSVISKCSKKFKGKCCTVQKLDCAMLHRESGRSSVEALHDLEFSSKNSSKLRSCDERCTDHSKTEENKENTEKEALACNNTFVDTINDKKSSTVTDPVKQLNKETVYSSDNNQTNKSKKNVSIQTTEKTKWRRRKSRKDIENDQKENIAYVSTNQSSSKDIKTIFTTDRASFDSEKSKTNLEALGTRYTRRQKGKKLDRKYKKHDTECSLKKKLKIHASTSTDKKQTASCFENTNLRKRFVKKTIKNMDSSSETVSRFNADNLTIYKKCNNEARDRSLILIQDQHRGLKKILTNKMENGTNTSTNLINSGRMIKSREKIVIENSVLIKPNASSRETLNESRSQNYSVEDKTSELMILGKVKKRLEEDYDDYFSLNDVDPEEDLFLDAEDTTDIPEINKPSSEVQINHYALRDNPERSRSMLTTASVTRHQETKQELSKRSVRTSLTCASSVRFSNSDLSRAGSSYHTSLREQECSPSSSIEYCTASNVSLTRLQSRNNSLDALLETCSMDNGVKYNCSKDAREFLDRALVNSYTVCCYRRSSTPNFTNSSRLVTESLDSGILTDFSLDKLGTISRERFRDETGKKDCGEGKRDAREVDLLPTYDFNTDSSYSDESLNRRIDVVVKKFTENLILTERKARTRLRRMEKRRKRRRNSRQVKKASECIPKRSSTFESSPRLNDDDWIMSSSTPPLFSFSDSEMDHL